DVGQVFASLPEALLDAWYREDPKAVLAWGKEALDVTAPPMLPPPIEEGMQQLANKDFFFDSPVVPQHLERAPAAEQYTEYTSRVAKFLGRTFEASPARIDHAMRNLFGPVSGDIFSALGLGPAGKDQEAEAADLFL